MADLQLAVAVKPESYVKRPVALGIFEMSMHSLPRVGFRTGSSTEVPATCRVAMDGASPALFSMADTLALLLGVPPRWRARAGNQADREIGRASCRERGQG